MIYRVRKTSDWSDNKPCDGAYRITVPCWDIRCCNEQYYDTVTENNVKGKLWRDRGTEHCRVTPSHKVTANGSYIARRLEDKKVWVIDISTLEQLDKFVDRHGKCIIGKDNFGSLEEYDTLEIYDGYRE